jgi:hypothetical protein
LQAQARAHRIGQKKTVNIYRFVTMSSVEESIIERAKQKMVLDHLVIQRMNASGRLDTGSKAPDLNREELDAVMRFGAEGLFKEEEDESADAQLEQLSIDDILNRAETQDSGEPAAGAGDELLSQFKTVNIAMDEDDDVDVADEARPKARSHSESQAVSVDGETSTSMTKKIGPSWDDIVPQKIRQEADEIEAQRIALESFIPRKRKAATNASRSLAEQAIKAETVNSVPEDTVAGITSAEAKRFVRSYRKFALESRLKDIASDASLSHLPGDVMKAAFAKLEQLIDQAQELREARDKAKVAKSSSKKSASAKQSDADDGTTDSASQPIQVRFHSVSYNLEELLIRKTGMPALSRAIVASKGAFRLTDRLKDPGWGIEWPPKCDSTLLIGCQRYGVGNWLLVKSDPELDLGLIIPEDPKGKPQGKNLETRVDYLLRLLLTKEANNSEASTKQAHKASKAKDQPTIDSSMKSKAKQAKSDKHAKEPKASKPKLTSTEPVVGKSSSTGSKKTKASNPVLDFFDFDVWYNVSQENLSLVGFIN